MFPHDGGAAPCVVTDDLSVESANRKAAAIKAKSGPSLSPSRRASMGTIKVSIGLAFGVGITAARMATIKIANRRLAREDMVLF